MTEPASLNRSAKCTRVRLADALAILMAAWLWPSAAQACSCPEPGPLAVVIDRVSDAFVGEVIGRWPLILPVEENRRQQRELLQTYTFRVVTRWKGAETDEIEVVSANTDCEYRFEVGETYAVFTYRDARHGGRRSTSLCLPNRRAQEMTPEYEALKCVDVASPTAGKFGESWSHRIARLAYTSLLVGLYESTSRWDVGLSEAGRLLVVSLMAILVAAFMFPVARRVRRRPALIPIGLAALAVTLVLWFLAAGFYQLQSRSALEVFR